MSPACLDESAFGQLLASDATEESLARWQSHLESCASCRDRYARYSADMSGLAAEIRGLRSGSPTIGATLAGATALSPAPGGERPDEPWPTIPGYEILGRVGKGGMGEVYEAQQIELKRIVALKVLRRKPGQDFEVSRRRFQNEAQIASRLHHTHIVPIHDFKHAEAYDYYAMELVEGELLSTVIRSLAEAASPQPLAEDATEHAEDAAARTPPPSSSGGTSAAGRAHFKQAASWIRDVARALEYIHHQNIIHRDIKPNNLIFSRDGRLMILDFGLAKQIEPGVNLTQDGEFLGTPAYMSPELAMAGRVEVDHRTDIFSLGATLYELLTLRRAFPGENRKDVLHKVSRKDPPRPRRIARGVPEQLEDICMKMLEKDADDRFSSAGRVAEELDRFIQDQPPGFKPVSLIKRGVKFARRHPAGCGTACAVVLACAGIATALDQYSNYRGARCDALIREARSIHDAEPRNWALAEQKYREAAQLCPGDFRVWTNYAGLKQDRYEEEGSPGLLDEAEQLLARALELKPDSKGVLNLQGIILRNRGRYGESAAALQKALAVVDPAYSHGYAIHTNLASVYVLQERIAEAEVELAKAAQLVREKEGAGPAHPASFMPGLNLGAVLLCARNPAIAATLDQLPAEALRLPLAQILRARARLEIPEILDPNAAVQAASAAVGMQRADHAFAVEGLRTLALAQLRKGYYADAAATARQVLHPPQATDAPTPASAVGPQDNPLQPVGTPAAPAALQPPPGAAAGAKPARPDRPSWGDRLRCRLVLAIALARQGDAAGAREELSAAGQAWPADIAGARPRADVTGEGYVWFDCDDELLALRSEAEEATAAASGDPPPRSRP
jgi:serine/threonine protein kinase